MFLRNEIDLFLSHAMPLLFSTTALYTAFSLTACLASSVNGRVAACFQSARAKTAPFFVIAVALAGWRML